MCCPRQTGRRASRSQNHPRAVSQCKGAARRPPKTPFLPTLRWQGEKSKCRMKGYAVQPSRSTSSTTPARFPGKPCLPTPQVSDEIQTVFRSFDADRSGTLNVTELAEAFAAMVSPCPACPPLPSRHPPIPVPTICFAEGNKQHARATDQRPGGRRTPGMKTVSRARPKGPTRVPSRARLPADKGERTTLGRTGVVQDRFSIRIHSRSACFSAEVAVVCPRALPGASAHRQRSRSARWARLPTGLVCPPARCSRLPTGLVCPPARCSRLPTGLDCPPARCSRLPTGLVCRRPGTGPGSSATGSGPARCSRLPTGPLW